MIVSPSGEILCKQPPTWVHTKVPIQAFKVHFWKAVIFRMEMFVRPVGRWRWHLPWRGQQRYLNWESKREKKVKATHEARSSVFVCTIWKKLIYCKKERQSQFENKTCDACPCVGSHTHCSNLNSEFMLQRKTENLHIFRWIQYMLLTVFRHTLTSNKQTPNSAEQNNGSVIIKHQPSQRLHTKST